MVLLFVSDRPSAQPVVAVVLRKRAPGCTDVGIDDQEHQAHMIANMVFYSSLTVACALCSASLLSHARAHSPHVCRELHEMATYMCEGGRRSVNRKHIESKC